MTVQVPKLGSTFTGVRYIAYSLLCLSNKGHPEIISEYILGFGEEEGGAIKSAVFHKWVIFHSVLSFAPKLITIFLLLVQ